MIWAMLLAAPLAAKEYSHQKYFEHYEGTKTCLSCHEKEAKSFFRSQHYQWRGQTPNLVNARGQRLGKINTINDFCTNPRASWIGVVKNSRGEAISEGCSKCHAGLGLMPSEQETPEQLANIDCLICHAQGYQRDLYPDGQGGWVWKPVLWKNQEGLDAVAKRIGMPTRNTCLRCHAGSGGGPNFKRGDLEYALADTTRDFDVHMGTDGANLQCIDCHKGEDHRVRGRGSDLSGTDFPAKPLSCDDGTCHDSRPHPAEVLNLHAQRVACPTCHIPTFAKADATDMVRDWSKPAYNQEADKWSATIEFAKDVKPVYAWFNGTTWAQLPGEPVKLQPDGTVGMMLPQGSRKDPKARIYPFKLHRGVMPVLEGKNYILPIAVEEFFAEGEIHKAIQHAAEEMYGVKDARYGWVKTKRYMGIYHEVVPKEKALTCLDCHGPNGRLDWKALGYGADPILQRWAKTGK
ncbi:hypothetical protein EG19_00225 [Thermoanaerobaculum aquaticum]|uniref:Cytochrome C n=1 Tax=Thermoanaerobaculum aquaticum TaxID=1312852 RepID=A0A062XR53_9BACT|nr:hypothetical protein EG19_00225 [Thermoanaerobaculum aquaticum]